MGDQQQQIAKLMQGFINLEKGLSLVDSRSEAMEKETYDVLAKMVQRINDHKGVVDTLAGTVKDMQQQLQKLTIMVNDLALKAKDAESKPKRTTRKKAAVENPAVPVQPTAPVVPVQPTAPVQPWDGVEFPIVRCGMEITVPLIAQCHIFELGHAPKPKDIPDAVIEFIHTLSQEQRAEILNLYGYNDEEEEDTGDSEGVDQVLTAINTGD